MIFPKFLDHFTFSFEFPLTAVIADMGFQYSTKVAEPAMDQEHESCQTVKDLSFKESGEKLFFRKVFIKHKQAVPEVQECFERGIVVQ